MALSHGLALGFRNFAGGLVRSVKRVVHGGGHNDRQHQSSQDRRCEAASPWAPRQSAHAHRHQDSQPTPMDTRAASSRPWTPEQPARGSHPQAAHIPRRPAPLGSPRTHAAHVLVPRQPASRGPRPWTTRGPRWPAPSHRPCPHTVHALSRQGLSRRSRGWPRGAWRGRGARVGRRASRSRRRPGPSGRWSG
jgi:hypothetical protein